MFLFLCLALQIAAYGQKKSCAVALIDATSKKWVAGAGGRTGTAYQIQFKVKTNLPVNFSQLWIGEKNMPITLEYNAFVPPANTKKGDTVYVTTNLIDNLENLDFLPKKLPFRYKGVALLELIVANKTQYLTVKSFKPLLPATGE